MKKLIFGLLVGAVLVNTAFVASASPNDAKGPACVDIVDGLANFTGSTFTSFDVVTDAPGCAQFDYTVTAYTDPSATQLIGTVTASGDGSSTLVNVDFVDTSTAFTEVCVVTTTTSPGGHHVFDQAPDADAGLNCLPIGPGGGTQHN